MILLGEVRGTSPHSLGKNEFSSYLLHYLAFSRRTEKNPIDFAVLNTKFQFYLLFYKNPFAITQLNSPILSGTNDFGTSQSKETDQTVPTVKVVRPSNIVTQGFVINPEKSSNLLSN